MKATNYPGLDYSGPGSAINRDKETGIRYGVISQNSVMPEALNDVEYDYGKPEDTECPSCGQRCTPPESWGEDVHCGDCDEDFEVEMPDFMEPCGWTYDGEGYKLTDCLDNDIFVIKSPYYTYAQFCSPCVPGAGNLDNPFEAEPDDEEASLKYSSYEVQAQKAGFPKTYCLAPDWFDDYRPCPYPVFSVETGEQVLPTK